MKDNETRLKVLEDICGETSLWNFPSSKKYLWERMLCFPILGSRLLLMQSRRGMVHVCFGVGATCCQFFLVQGGPTIHVK